MSAWRRVGLALGALAVVTLIGTVGYLILGFPLLDAVYQTVTTITTVGYREVRPLDDAGKIFTIVLIIGGVGTALYTLGALLETLIEGHLQAALGRRRMERDIERFQGHTIVCGWGRVGQTIAQHSVTAGAHVVIIDSDAERLTDCPHPYVVGDATDDGVLERAGLERASAAVAAVADDASNLFIVVSARALRPDILLVARVRSARNEAKLLSAGADRVVNPQQLGGGRMAAYVNQPHAAEFLDVVMHDGSLEFRLADLALSDTSELAGLSLRDARLRDRTGAMVLAIRKADGTFLTNPPADTVLEAGHVLVVVGTQAQIDDLRSSGAR